MPSFLSEQSLYVMQNQFGLIKVGRSIDPERRRLKLQSRERCQIELVLVRHLQGRREEEFHIDLSEHRLAGEWFDGVEETRAAVASAFSPSTDIDWPFKFDVNAATAWLEEFEDREAARVAPRELLRLYGELRTFTEPSWIVDLRMWAMYWLMEGEERPISHVARNRPSGEVVVTSRIDGALVTMPRFSRDIEAALSLWPASVAPTTWDGDLLECCKAALDARYSAWRAQRGLKPAPPLVPAARR